MQSLNGISVVPGRSSGPAHWLDSTDAPCGTVALVRGMLSPYKASLAHLACAVVCTGGGTTSHGAILLRQWGIPCVSGIVNLDSVPEGANVDVDAFSGTVRFA